jgi:DNA-binding response OmpR family regulator
MAKQNKILVVDDSTANLLGLQKILEKENYFVHTTAKGEEALDIMKSQDIDVVLLDIMMPGFSGFDVLEKMRKDKIMRNIPVIIVSARSDSQDVQQALEKGAVDYIKKPIDIVELLARTKAAIRLKAGGSIDIENYNKILDGIAEIDRLIAEFGKDKLEKVISAAGSDKDKLEQVFNEFEKLKGNI